MDLTPNSRHGSRDGHRTPTRVGIQSARSTGTPRTDEDVHICPSCASELVQPVEWAPVDMRRWRVELRCPECGWEDAGVFPQHILDRFDEILDDGTATMINALERLRQENMEDEVARFVAALDAGQILPEDF